jgi:hypothetical protein
MQSWVGKIAIICVCAASLAGCGGGSKANNVVTQVTVTPTSLSLVPGDVAQLSTAALNSANSSVISTITYTSSNANVVTISTGGLVCAGVWDANFIVCNKGATGTANITATAGGVNSTPVPVSVHVQVASITVQQTPPTSTCTSVKQTQQYEAHAFDASHNEITNQVGPFTWTQTIATVGTVDTNGLVTANAPGLMGVVAKVSNVSSPASSFKTCMPVAIRLHLASDSGTPTTSASMNPTQTLTLQADIDDEAGVTTFNAPVSIVSNNGTVASVSSTTLTANSPGGAGILAACVPPGCGANLNLPIYSNLFKTTVNGTSPVTTVYASTTFAPPSGTFSTVVPIDTSTNTVGTAINLPGPPNSLVFTSNGAKGYMGTTAGLASLDTATNIVTLVASNVIGKVLAVSPDGNSVIVSNAASAPDPVTGVPGPIQPDPTKQRLVIFLASTNTVENFVFAGAVAAAFTNDNFKAFIVTNDNSGNLDVFSPFISLQTINVPGAGSSVTTLPSGPFAYLVNNNSGTISVQSLATCNNKPQASLTTTSTPQAVGSFANNNIVVTVNDTGLDVTTATVATPLTPPIDSTSCVPGVSYANSFIDFGLGTITARQLLVPGDAVGNNTNPANGTHIVVLPVGIPKLLTAIPSGGPTIINLAGGGTEALSGGLTLDGNTAWVGVAGTNTVDKIDLAGAADTNQIATSFKKSDGTAAPPNLVAVKPK